jgi:hypothetical protein
MSDTLTLANIFARDVAVEWFEAVAVVRDVADRVRENLGGRSVPELDQIEVTAEGQVRLSGANETDEPVRRLGQLLQATLVQTDPPVQLRLTASQATAPTPAFGTIREYDEALAYYERPDREGVLRGLYARAANAPALIGGWTSTLDEIAPIEHQHPVKSRIASPPQPRSRLRPIPMFVAAVVVFIGSAAFWYQWTAAPSDMGVSKFATTASDAIGTALVAGISKVSDAAGLGRLAPANSSATPAPTTVAAAPVVAPSSPAPRTVRRPDPLPFRVFDLSPRNSSLTVAALPAGSPAEPVSDPPPAPEVASDTAVYSAADGEVTPPVGLRPQLPAVLPADVRKEQLGQIELTILSDGTVGAVKLLGERRGVLEAMLLSAAKTWTFKAATKDGRPVAYKKIVWLARR